MPAPGIVGDIRMAPGDDIVSNVWGQLAFSAVLSGPGISSDNDSILYAVQRDGSLVPLLRRGSEFEYAPGQVGTITEFMVAPHSLGAVTPNVAMNARGELALTVKVDGLIESIVMARIECRADVNADKALDLFDYLVFQGLFAQHDPRADFTGDDILDIFDFFRFLNEFGAGCG
jgi:hypothetical protein